MHNVVMRQLFASVPHTRCQLLAETLHVRLQLCLGCLHVRTQQHSCMSTSYSVHQVVCLIKHKYTVVDGDAQCLPCFLCG